jgi:hypothetical protein
MMRLAFLALFPILAFGQIGFVAQKTTALSAAAEVITIQQPVSGSRTVELKSAYVDCSAACTVMLERNGNPATTTALTSTAINPGEGTATAATYYSSNVGSGTTISVVSVAAGSYTVLDLSNIRLVKNNPGNNFTIRTSSISGTVNITLLWTER